jgi:hypothetical protein
MLLPGVLLSAAGRAEAASALGRQTYDKIKKSSAAKRRKNNKSSAKRGGLNR